MRHKVRDLGVFFCLAGMLFTVTSCGKEVSDQTIAATEQSSEERRVLFVMARVLSRMIVFSVMERRNVRYVAEAEKCREESQNGRTKLHKKVV